MEELEFIFTDNLTEKQKNKILKKYTIENEYSEILETLINNDEFKDKFFLDKELFFDLKEAISEDLLKNLIWKFNFISSKESKKYVLRTVTIEILEKKQELIIKFMEYILKNQFIDDNLIDMFSLFFHEKLPLFKNFFEQGLIDNKILTKILNRISFIKYNIEKLEFLIMLGADIFSKDNFGISFLNKVNAFTEPQIEGVKKMLNNKKEAIYFFGTKNENAFLSNFYFINYKGYNDKMFFCSEQEFMYRKALFFKDEEIANKILIAKTAIESKRLGRKVRNYNEVQWRKNRYKIMCECLYNKFKTKELKDLLLNTNDKLIAEASPFDKIWGIGIKAEDAKENIAWQGSNLLGLALMEIRKALR